MLFSAPTTDSGWTEEALPIHPNEKNADNQSKEERGVVSK